MYGFGASDRVISKQMKELYGITLSPSAISQITDRILPDLNAWKNRPLQRMMVDAIHAVFPDALVQRCIVHQLRNCFKLVPYKDRRALAQDMKLIYRAPTLYSAEQVLDELEAKWGAKYPRVIKAWRDNWNELSTFYSLPVEMQRLVYTTNAIENYNRGLRKYTKNSVQFPTEQVLEKHLYLAMLRIIANWHGQVYCWHRILNQLLLQFGDRIRPEDPEIVMRFISSKKVKKNLHKAFDTTADPTPLRKPVFVPHVGAHQGCIANYGPSSSPLGHLAAALS